MIAPDAMRALKSKGYRIPEDVAIVGFDNITFSALCEPLLTTINEPKQYMGKVAMHETNRPGFRAQAGAYFFTKAQNIQVFFV